MFEKHFIKFSSQDALNTINNSSFDNMSSYSNHGHREGCRVCAWDHIKISNQSGCQASIKWKAIQKYDIEF